MRSFEQPPETFCASVVGVDGAGKGAVCEAILNMAAQDFPLTVTIGRPSYEARNGEISKLYPRRRQAWTACLALATGMMPLTYLMTTEGV